MPRRRRQPPALNSISPKSQRGLQDPKFDSTAPADRGVPPPTEGAASTPQAHHPPRSPGFTAPRTPQRHDGCSIPSAAASPARAPHQSRAARPAATATTSSGPQHRAVGTVRGPLNQRQQAAAAKTPSSAAALKTTPPSLQVQSTSPPARARTPSPSRGSRSSSLSSSGPSHMSWDSTGSSVMPYSYAEAVKGRANQSPDANLVQRLLDYLIKFAILPEMTANHDNKGPIITVRDTGNSDLRIVEEHLAEYDQELSCAVFNSQDDRFKEWLYPTISQFLISKGIVNNAVGGMNATFYTMPPSTKTLEDFVREQGPLVIMQSIFDGKFKLCVASGIGMMLVHGFLVYILDIHKHGRTWNGEFSTCQMVVENCFKFRITKISKTGNSHCRAADLHRIAEIFKPMFTINEKMALYFDVLLEHLSKVNNGDVEAKWYREYLLSHPALKPSTARYYLECGLHHAADTTKTNGDPIPSVFQEGSDWMAIIPPQVSEDKPDSCLHTVFWFNHKPNEDFSPFAPTVEGLVRYKRHLLQHGQKHIKVQDHTELEQFAAKTFPLALPNILRGLLSRSEMNGPFKGYWEAYCSSRVGNDGNIEGRTGIHISFCEDGRAGGKA